MMIKRIERKTFKQIIMIFFLLLFVELAIVKLKEGISTITLLEITSALLMIIIYYFLIRLEFRMASNVLKEELDKIRAQFELLEKRLGEELNLLKKETSELHTTIKELDRRGRLLKPKKKSKNKV